MEIFRHCLKVAAEAKNCGNLLGKRRKLLYNQAAQDFVFLIAVVGRRLSACRLMFPGIYARTQASEWMSSILPEPLGKHDVEGKWSAKSAVQIMKFNSV